MGLAFVCVGVVVGSFWTIDRNICSFVVADLCEAIPNLIVGTYSTGLNIDVEIRMICWTFLAAESLLVPDRFILRASG